MLLGTPPKQRNTIAFVTTRCQAAAEVAIELFTGHRRSETHLRNAVRSGCMQLHHKQPDIYDFVRCQLTFACWYSRTPSSFKFTRRVDNFRGNAFDLFD